jgi:Tol biopolymer transport system component
MRNRVTLVAMLTGFLALAAGSSGAAPASRILFAENASGHYNISSLPATGGVPLVLTTSKTAAFQPDASPDGTKIAFVACRSNCSPFYKGSQIFIDTTAVFVMNADGTAVKQLTPWAPLDEYPTWSPDGGKIAFESDTPEETGTHVWEMNADGSDPIRLTSTTATEDGAPTWSPDGKRIAFLRTINNGRTLSVLTIAGGEVDSVFTASTIANPVWSPDGSELAFSHEAGHYPFQIFRIGADGTGLTQVTHGSSNKLFPAWSPDGKQVAFVACGPSAREGTDGCNGTSSNIDTISVSGGKPTVLLRSTTSLQSWLTWH